MNSQSITKALGLGIVCLTALLLSGCASGVLPGGGRDITMTERVFGVRVLTSSTAQNNVPEIDCGASSTVFRASNVSTNQLYAVPAYSAVTATASANPSNTALSEQEGQGSVSTSVNTNGIGGNGTVVKAKAPVFQDVQPETK